MSLKEKWYAIVNPGSAKGKTKDRWPGFYSQMKQAGVDLDYAYTTGQGDGKNLAKAALDSGYRRIIAVGGDGTVNEVVNGLIFDDKPLFPDIHLAVFEHGTGSDFIRTLNPHADLKSFIDSLHAGHHRLIDIGKVVFLNSQKMQETRYFLNASNLGIGAEVVQRVNQGGKKWGSKLAYLAETLLTILHFQNIAVSMQLDQTQRKGVFCGLMVCNGQFIGGGMQIAPHALLEDGFLDVIAIKDITKLKLFTSFPLIYKGKHIDLPEIEIYRCRSIIMQTPDTAIIEVDGEIIGTSPKEFSILPQCLKIRI
ncbi:MAG: diacylglycerol kinase family lipid kinase [Peptococcaceae bacterium]|nr:diacylglycerol kinase family lipid kinase [Peptococcaceae bacterium]